MEQSDGSRIRALITGTGRYVPDDVWTSDDGRGPRRRVQRRLAHPQGHHPTRHRCRRAALRARRRLLVRARRAGGAACAGRPRASSPVDIDLLIFASASHDVAEPATANMRAGRARLRPRRGDGREERVQQLPQRPRRRAGVHRDRPGDACRGRRRRAPLTDDQVGHRRLRRRCPTRLRRAHAG